MVKTIVRDISNKPVFYHIKPDAYYVKYTAFSNRKCGVATLERGANLIANLGIVVGNCKDANFKTAMTLYEELCPKTLVPTRFLQMDFDTFRTTWFIPVYE
jgi:hypothetical protein